MFYVTVESKGKITSTNKLIVELFMSAFYYNIIKTMLTEYIVVPSTEKLLEYFFSSIKCFSSNLSVSGSSSIGSSGSRWYSKLTRSSSEYFSKSESRDSSLASLQR